MRGADGDREAVHTGLRDEAHRVVDVRVDDLRRPRFAVAVIRSDGAELTLDLDADGMRGIHDLLRERDVLVEGQEGRVDHDGRESGLDRRDHLFVGAAVVPVDRDGHGRVVGAGAHCRDEIGRDVRDLVGMDRDDDRSVLLLADVHDAQEHGPVADVEGRDGEVVLIGDVEDGLAGVQHHDGFSCFGGWVGRISSSPSRPSGR